MLATLAMLAADDPSSFSFGDSVVAGALIVTVGIFLRFLDGYRKDAAAEMAEERKVYRETLAGIDARHERVHAELLQRIDAIAREQRESRDSIEAQLRQMNGGKNP